MSKHTISFQNAFRGIWISISTQANIRIHFAIASLVIFAAVYLQLTTLQILILILCIGFVMLAEMINTAIEFLCDAVTLEHNDYIKQAKDVSAGAVLISAIFVSLIGLAIFIPQLLKLM